MSITRLCTGTGVCLRTCTLTYPACNAHAQYFLRPLWLHEIFRHYHIKGTIFGGGGGLLNIKCTFWFSLELLLETYLILRIIQSDIVTNVKYTLFLSDFNETRSLSTDFRKQSRISNLIKVCPVGAELFHADGQTDTTKLIVAFRNFANAPKMTWISYVRLPAGRCCRVSYLSRYGDKFVGWEVHIGPGTHPAFYSMGTRGKADEARHWPLTCTQCRC
jgi:hypothetical protein